MTANPDWYRAETATGLTCYMLLRPNQVPVLRSHGHTLTKSEPQALHTRLGHLLAALARDTGALAGTAEDTAGMAIPLVTPRPLPAGVAEAPDTPSSLTPGQVVQPALAGEGVR